VYLASKLDFHSIQSSTCYVHAHPTSVISNTNGSSVITSSLLLNFAIVPGLLLGCLMSSPSRLRCHRASTSLLDGEEGGVGWSAPPSGARRSGHAGVAVYIGRITPLPGLVLRWTSSAVVRVLMSRRLRFVNDEISPERAKPQLPIYPI